MAKERNWWNHRRRGGAWLLTEIINAALNAPSFSNYRTGLAKTYELLEDDDEVVSMATPHYLSSLATLGLFPQAAASSVGDKKTVYRIEKLVGWVHNNYDVVTGKNEVDVFQNRLIALLDRLLQAEKVNRDILVLHDKAGHFRCLPEERLEQVIDREFTPGRTWIVWQMYSHLANGNLWNVIARKQERLDRTIAVVKMESLREEGVNLPRTTSLRKSADYLRTA